MDEIDAKSSNEMKTYEPLASISCPPTLAVYSNDTVLQLVEFEVYTLFVYIITRNASRRDGVSLKFQISNPKSSPSRLRTTYNFSFNKQQRNASCDSVDIVGLIN